MALHLQLNAFLQDPENPMKCLCDLAFVNYLLKQYGFNEAQKQALFQYIQKIDHTHPWTMDHSHRNFF